VLFSNTVKQRLRPTWPAGHFSVTPSGKVFWSGDDYKEFQKVDEFDTNPLNAADNISSEKSSFKTTRLI
jgi:hypothetical protein